RGLPPGWLCDPADPYCQSLSGTDYHYAETDMWSGVATLLPYVDQQPLASSIDFRYAPGHFVNLTAISSSIEVFVCPANHSSAAPVPVHAQPGDPSSPILMYLGVSDYRFSMAGSSNDPNDPRYGIFDNGIAYRNSATPLGSSGIPDGDSSTLLLGESLQGWWALAPGCCVRTVDGWSINFIPRVGSETYWASKHGRGSMFALADTSTRFIAETIDRRVFVALATRNGGEIVPADY
ncbi:MAG: DUF1559 domain-containing protein, partial [Planctomycetes bacterium]|nr:DUF1559 domain-containing protein [Planctomycetota bacterium]